jgi:penicillin amidase
MSRITGLAAAAALFGRAALHPPPRHITTAQRLAMLATTGAPLRAPVEIHWDDHQIPHIDAAHDQDLACAFGIVHAHLRLGQMELMRRLAQGRVAEAVGPLGIPLDRTLRLMDFGRAVPEIIARLDPATRAWAEAFVAGINHQMMHGELPHEHRLLGLAREAWTLADLFTTARLAAADVSWLVASRLLRARATASPEEWARLWPLLLGGGAAASWPAPPDAAAGLAEAALARAARPGSNSAAVAGSRSASGSAMIASDPHLSLALPNLWLIAGGRSPGFHAVGLMLVGFPFVALGRNTWIAWGGTSLHAASSELHDVSALKPEAFTERAETIRVRFARPVTQRLRESPLGPVVSDGMLFPHARPLALRWVGQRPSDEIGAMLGVARARNWEEFAAALHGFAVPGQTMVFASAAGPVGRLTAAWLPRRPAGDPPDLVASADPGWDLDDLAGPDELPRCFDPPEGFVVSANERPSGGAGRDQVPVGFFFSSGARARRMRTLLSGGVRLTPDDLVRLQLDVVQPEELRLRDLILAAARRLALPPTPVLHDLAAWDGGYAATSRGALVFETMLAALARGLHPKRRLSSYAAVWTTRALVGRDLEAAPEPTWRALLGPAIAQAARALRRYRNWGGMHRMRPAHHLAALPLLGRRYAFPCFPGQGGNDTVNKTGHPLTTRRHRVGFGACARHVSDLADPDDNRFVLYGGQDGWFGSENFLDQLPLWREGRLITVPLRTETARARFPHRTVLTPAT